MRRRDFIALIGGWAMLPRAASAQQGAGRMARIAYLGASSPAVFDPRQIEGFKQGLRENGLIEGRNITVDYFWAEGDRARLEPAGHVDRVEEIIDLLCAGERGGADLVADEDVGRA